MAVVVFHEIILHAGIRQGLHGKAGRIHAQKGCAGMGSHAHSVDGNLSVFFADGELLKRGLRQGLP